MKRCLKTVLPGVSLLLMMSACHHKDLCFDHLHEYKVNVVFDWQNAPDANPASMALFMYDRGETDRPIGEKSMRFMFSNRDGGRIRIPFGYYNGLCLNSDNSDWAHFRNTDDIENFELYTEEVEQLTSYGLSTRGVPRAEGAEDERITRTPGMVWSSRKDYIALPLTGEDTVRTIVMYPEEIVCHYTVDVYDVANISSIDGSTIDATLSGMAEGYLHGQNRPSDTKVTNPFTLDVDDEGAHLHGEFLTFGESKYLANPHKLTIYMMLNDHTKWYHSYDVTDQVAKAEDPHHVHIIVRGLPLPKPFSQGGGEGGLRPNVEDWQTVYVDLKM